MRPRGPNSAINYAKELGISTRLIARLGGVAKLRALDESARAVLLKPNCYGNSRTVADGGLRGRGMLSRYASGPGSTKPRGKQDERQPLCSCGWTWEEKYDRLYRVRVYDVHVSS